MDWVSTYSPQVARLTERLLETGDLPQNLQYAVPREYAETHPMTYAQTIWVYRGASIVSGEPFDLTSAQSGTDL